MADITDKKGKKLEWYKYVVKRYLRDILQDLANSKNQMERSYYETRYACQLDAFAKALNYVLNCWRSTSRSNDKDKLNFKQIDYVSIYFLSNRPMEHSFK